MSVLARMAYSSSRAIQGPQRPYFGRQPLPLPSAGEIIDANPSRSPWEVAPVVRPPGGNPNEIELPVGDESATYKAHDLVLNSLVWGALSTSPSFRAQHPRCSRELILHLLRGPKDDEALVAATHLVIQWTVKENGMTPLQQNLYELIFNLAVSWIRGKRVAVDSLSFHGLTVVIPGSLIQHHHDQFRPTCHAIFGMSGPIKRLMATIVARGHWLVYLRRRSEKYSLPLECPLDTFPSCHLYGCEQEDLTTLTRRFRAAQLFELPPLQPAATAQPENRIQPARSPMEAEPTAQDLPTRSKRTTGQDQGTDKATPTAQDVDSFIVTIRRQTSPTARNLEGLAYLPNPVKCRPIH